MRRRNKEILQQAKGRRIQQYSKRHTERASPNKHEEKQDAGNHNWNVITSISQYTDVKRRKKLLKKRRSTQGQAKGQT